MTNIAISQTREWVSSVIVKYNFCPFARKEVENNCIHYIVSNANTIDDAVMDMLEQCIELDRERERETTLIMFDNGFSDFEDFLDLVDLANALLVAQGFEGKYQIANFHPDYVFADSDETDPANYTNRAPFPTLHLIREASMSEALENYDEPESIPEHNINLARRKGIDFWQQLLENCKKPSV
ncbi:MULTISPECIES: DUF1415 domain-containing protein [Pseudoalteromonas]|uniref:DUF1415 domain-containing protein n=1 Tax=Pseudoalteromonas haloplanktis TaxID=228 RepID=A0A9W4VR04_PSEHA|nr:MULTISPECIES: DUF1415 domain-containing protein [Pseudoalteromonas]MDN3490733.1 DUF1415 domain-containing protein [Pseudoalteromonas sp. APC 3694]TMO25706.1 DUF1415 domain-containing protein [Pseudoalteromonas sp. S4741]TMP49925.1 DUF1415 domain-containing protein [Pseudoalteromonas sp. S1688]TMS93666.1 DUF1415 domain-containing protein [Pseudoalteromonas sp. S201]CAH9058444.1 hypothetical protein PSEHALCIP103_01864 [Pseudoalteromonas haloplanktis]